MAAPSFFPFRRRARARTRPGCTLMELSRCTHAIENRAPVSRINVNGGLRGHYSGCSNLARVWPLNILRGSLLEGGGAIMNEPNEVPSLGSHLLELTLEAFQLAHRAAAAVAEGLATSSKERLSRSPRPGARTGFAGSRHRRPGLPGPLHAL